MKMYRLLGRTLATAAISTAILFNPSPSYAENTDPHDPVLVLAGDSFVSIIRPSQIPDGGNYYDASIWEWDARVYATSLGIDMSHVDEAKIVDNGTKVLVTSSAHWAILVDYATKKTLFYSTGCRNAHSAEMLPGNRVVIACSTSEGELQVYDIDRPNQIVFRTPLSSGHGAVWVESRQRLYANGGNKLNIYKLKDWDTDAPELELEKSITTPKKGTHDLSFVDDNTLCISGRGCYLFDLNTENFTELPFFSEQTALKSTNYNAATGEMWYTDSTEPEGDYSWSTQTVHHTYNGANGPDHCTFKTKGLNLYKVRVLDWGHSSGSIPSIGADDNGNSSAVEWFDLKGRSVVKPASGLYIRRQGSTSDKVMVK